MHKKFSNQKAILLFQESVFIAENNQKKRIRPFSSYLLRPLIPEIPEEAFHLDYSRHDT